MKNLYSIGGIAIIAGLGLYAFIQFGKPSSTVVPVDNTPTVTNINANVNSNTNTNTNTSTASGGYTMVQISVHSSAQDCWLLISNKVYNVTNYINQHPGGSQMITNWCGQEATQAFATQDGNGRHSGRAQQMLGGYFIGNLQA